MDTKITLSSTYYRRDATGRRITVTLNDDGVDVELINTVNGCVDGTLERIGESRVTVERISGDTLQAGIGWGNLNDMDYIADTFEEETVGVFRMLVQLLGKAYNMHLQNA